MTRFVVIDTLFGDSAIFYHDPISGKQKEMHCNPESLENFKALILRKQMREIAAWLYFNRSKAFDFLQKSNPHHITPGFRKGIIRLREEISNTYAHEDTKVLASHISLNIIPDFLSTAIAPHQEKPEAQRYFKLADELEKITHEILNSDLLDNAVKTSAENNAILVS